MMKFLTIVLLGVFALPEEPVFLSGEQRRAMLEEVEQAMAEVKLVVATFQQDKQLALFDETIRTEGAILFQSPDRLRWEITEPFQSVLIVAGDDAAKFEVDGGRFKALELGRGKDALLFVMSEIRGWFRGRFTNTKGFQVDVAREPEPLIRLTPKEIRRGQSLTAIELRIAKELDLIDRVTIREQGGDTTVMRFTSVTGVKGKLDEAFFSTRRPRPLNLEQLVAETSAK